MDVLRRTEQKSEHSKFVNILSTCKSVDTIFYSTDHQSKVHHKYPLVFLLGKQNLFQLDIDCYMFLF